MQGSLHKTRIIYSVLCEQLHFLPPSFGLYLGQVSGTSYLLRQCFTAGMDSSHMAPHPLPSLLIHREATSVHIERHPSIPQLFVAFILLLLVSLLQWANCGQEHPLLYQEAQQSSGTETSWLMPLNPYTLINLLAGLSRCPRQMANSWHRVDYGISIS